MHLWAPGPSRWVGLQSRCADNGIRALQVSLRLIDGHIELQQLATSGILVLEDFIKLDLDQLQSNVFKLRIGRGINHG